MTIKEAANQNSGFQYVVESLELLAGVSRRILYNTDFSADPMALQKQWDDTEFLLRTLKQDCDTGAVRSLGHSLMQVRDISTTLRNCGNGVVLDDIQLFEIKNFSMLCSKIRADVETLDLNRIVDIGDFTHVVSLLDPDRTGVPHFYIYDSYDSRLPQIRRELRALQAGNAGGTENPRLAELWQQNADMENDIRTKLSETLQPFAGQLVDTLQKIGDFDILLAKARLAMNENLCKPAVSEKVDFQGLFNMRLRNLLKEQQLEFQPVDIESDHGLCLVTGANMAGKTVLLKSLGTAQLMAQFGFFVPARKADIPLVDDVVFCIGDEQDEMNGLSSFASEILKINGIIERAKTERLLVLVDEPARTTNPVEGMAIVKAVAVFLSHRNSFSFMTTHYSGLNVDCKKLRVRGLRKDIEDLETVTPQNINSFIDYTLVEDSSENVPREAIRIAEIFGFDRNVLENAKEFLGKQSGKQLR